MNDRSEYSELPLSIQRKIDSICLQFETLWRDTTGFQIEDFEFEIEDQWYTVALAELLLTEVDLLHAFGNIPKRDEYYERFSDHHDLVNAAFDRIELIGLIELDEKASLVSTRLVLPGTEDEEHSGSFIVSAKGHRWIPKVVGGYAIEQLIGNGSFGVVFRARRLSDNEVVALKFPKHGKFASDKEMSRFLDEAKEAQRLDHPGIVKTYQIGRERTYLFIVQEFVDGQDLDQFDKSQMSYRDIASLMADVADAIADAHRSGLYHRDIKPSNILIDDAGKPKVIDFGLAVHESVQRRRKGERVGSPAYMSPELVRGETHLIDGRSDIWSLGIILYELLIGRRPFKGVNQPGEEDDSLAHEKRTKALYSEIQFRPAAPLRQTSPGMSEELERICLRCLRKRISDRYLTASDLANDLRRWLQQPKKPGGDEDTKTPIVPQGLRPYGPDEAEFFCRLLPGAKDRTGLPVSVRFWKKRIESTAPEVTFPIGFIYGPSGSGKSSFFRAGVLPRLADHVTPIYVESTAEDTEVRVIKALRKQEHFEKIPSDLSLPEIFDGLRGGSWIPRGKKLLFIFDQFEQWLHSHKPSLREQFIQALRHCDGKNLQAICLVRDDFWLATTRFKDTLEVELVDGHNAMLVDRFDMDHARSVLIEFGQAYGRLPDYPAEPTKEQKRFLNQAIEGLSEDNRVISVRLSLFAEMFKNRPWTPGELKSVGGIAGIGETFLEETFTSKTAPRKYRTHVKAARAVLERLLPDERESNAEIRGHMLTREELKEVSTYAQQPEAFESLLELLDKDLRLITPASPDIGDLAIEPKNDNRHFQLTHDYLVKSIREWLLRDRRQTWRGRAKICLEAQTSEWNRTKETRSIPTFAETCLILTAIPKRKRTDSQRALMSAAKLRYGTRIAWFGSFVLAVTLLVSWLVNQNLVRAQMGRLEISDHHRGAVVTVARISDNLRIEKTKKIGKAPVSTYLPPGLYRVTIEDSNSRLEATSLIDAGAVDVVEVNVPSNELVASLVEIPGREYELGSVRATHPLDVHRRTEIPTFRISPTEVANREYREYVIAMKAPAPITWPSQYDKAIDDLPVSGISWDEANLYCRWRGVRLPTPDEWEAASKGPGGSKFPWGNKRNTDIRRNETPEFNFEVYRKFARPVGSDPHLATPKGIKHMLSNVQEYTEGIAVDRNHGLIVKGRSWRNSPYIDPSNTFTLSSRERGALDRGFRIAISTN